jgi:uncharacterized RDD family membrane protein YckC
MVEVESAGDKKSNGGLFKILSHPIRVRTIEVLHENIELSYTEILNILKIDAGQLNFHLKNMQGLYKKLEDGNYILTDKGKFAYHIIEEVKKVEGSEEAEVVTEPKASILKRALAAIIDTSLFIGSPLLVILFLSIWFPFSGMDPLLLTIFLMLVMFLTLIVHIAMEASTGQTIGKYILGIRVIKITGRKIDLPESTIRNVAKIYLLPIDLLLGLLFCRKKGHIRFACYLIKSKVVDIHKIKSE